MILVTGASGFIGGHVTRLLVERGDDVRVLVRPTSNLKGIQDLPVEKIFGDLRDPASLRQALQGCRQLYHVAADYRLWSRHPSELYRSNVDGTRNILQAAVESKIEKVVYTSTVGCMGFRRNGSPATEDSTASLEQMSGHYKRSKFMAEQVALEYAQRGLSVVIVNPTAPVGDRDIKPTPTGKIIVDFLRGAMPAYLDTGVNLVDVRDVAYGHLLAAGQGRPGERYLLGARNMKLEEIFHTLESLTGQPAPKVRIPYAVALAYGAVSTAAARVTRCAPRAPLDAVRMARKKMFVSSVKAERELGFHCGPIEDALARAIQWFRENQYC